MRFVARAFSYVKCKINDGGKVAGGAMGNP